MIFKSIKERLLETDKPLHMYDGNCPPYLIQNWLRRYWKDPESTLNDVTTIATAIDDTINMCAKKLSRKEILTGWGFTDDEADELLVELDA